MTLENPRSTARVAGHPIHPMLIPFPIAFLIGALVSDIVFTQTDDRWWATLSAILLGSGIVTALLAAVAGFIDFFGDQRIRALSHAWQHMLANLAAVTLALVNFVLRMDDVADPIESTGLILSAATVAILAFSGWRGGDLVYHHRVGVSDQREH
ncbi:DUF2231 domain-containing protein [Altererythrobacter soli]|uniref:DUF2231 domain-containing protein n=1 Tax=Croceibacterium soli TaxID=1739690 RepID=A0A6I4URS0_9SPHN|nr:DUF2231 domain-containing protein [Croceibacterium soli]MXP41491.1 DUF2231 domain-containing protein [Croceibacterium soli]